MKRFFKLKFIFIVASIFVSCNQSPPNYTIDGLPLSVDSAVNGIYKANNTNSYDTSIIRIITYKTNTHTFFNNSVPTTLSELDLDSIQKILTECIDKFNVQQNKKLIDLKKYKRQYVAVKNKNNEIEVYVNCLCSPTFIDWKKEIVTIKDGGICYFNLKINLTKMRYYEFNINPSA